MPSQDAAATVSELILAEDELARRARTTLAGAERAILVTGARCGRLPSARDVAITDDDGEPHVFWTALDAPPIDTPVGLIVLPPPRGGVRLSLRGRLTMSADVRADGQALVVLRVDEVSVGCPDPRAPAAAERAVSLAAYAAAHPDPFTAQLPRLARHMSSSHPAELRCFTAGAVGIRVEQIAAAELIELTECGIAVRWIDHRGAHDAAFVFGPVKTIGELGDALRQLMR